MSDFWNHAVHGCEPKDTVRATNEVRGAITGTFRPMQTEAGIELRGYRPVLLVKVKTGSYRMRHMFERFCRFNGLVARIPFVKPPVVERWRDENGNEVIDEPRPDEFTTVYEVTGGPALEKLTELRCVVDWHFPVNVRPPRFNSSTYRR